MPAGTLAPALDRVVAERYRVACPYEPIGKAFIIVERHGKDNVQIPLGAPLKCDYCGRYFKVGAKMTVYGKPLE